MAEKVEKSSLVLLSKFGVSQQLPTSAVLRSYDWAIERRESKE